VGISYPKIRVDEFPAINVWNSSISLITMCMCKDTRLLV